MATPPILTTTIGSTKSGRLDQRAVIDGDQRRALPAGRHIGGAKIISDRQAERLRELNAIADLYRETLGGAMNHGLAMKADDIDGSRIDHFRDQKVAHGLGMARCDAALGLRKDAGARRARGRVGRQVLRGGQSGAQKRAILVVVSERPRGALRNFRRAIRLDNGDINPVERCSAHQAKRARHRYSLPNGSNRLL